jgi:adenosine deaminase
VEWKYPKIDRHCHMGGSITPETIWEIIQHSGSYYIAKSLDEVRTRLTYVNDNVKGFTHFLSKFSILDKIDWDEWAIKHACDSICRNAIADGIEEIDISFSVDKYVRSGRWNHADIICLICEFYSAYRNQLKVGPFLSISYHSERAVQSTVAELIDNPRIAECVAGLDLVGDERGYDSGFYGPIIEDWNNHGKVTREHIAEMPYLSHNLAKVLSRKKIQRPKRIAHGIFGTDDDFKLARDNGIIFDLAITSNIITGAVTSIIEHPLPRMLTLGCLVTINTDDPVQFRTNLDREFELAGCCGLITEAEAKQIQENATISLR